MKPLILILMYMFLHISVYAETLVKQTPMKWELGYAKTAIETPSKWIPATVPGAVQLDIPAEICMDAGASFLKTSTGLNGGATIADVRLLKDITNDRVGIKASGGIRTVDQALELIVAGATRLGTSRGPDLIRQRDNLDKGQ